MLQKPSQNIGKQQSYDSLFDTTASGVTTGGMGDMQIYLNSI